MSRKVFAFNVMGTPRPKGSVSAFRKGVVTHTKQSKEWELAIRDQIDYNEEQMSGPVSVRLTFHLVRPKSNKNGRTYPNRPDIDKLCRTMLDAMQGVIFKDDGQVISLRADKIWCDTGREGVTIWVEEEKDVASHNA